MAAAIEYLSARENPYFMGSTPSLESFRNVTFETDRFVIITDNDSPTIARLAVSPLQAIDGVVSLAGCRRLVSQLPQYITSSKRQSTCGGCFSHQSVCLVTSLHSC